MMAALFVLGLLAGAGGLAIVVVPQWRAAVDAARAAGELGKRTEEFKRSLDPIAANLKRVSDEVARLEHDRRTTHGQVRQMFEAMSAEVGRLRDETGTLVTALRRPQVRGAWG